MNSQVCLDMVVLIPVASLSRKTGKDRSKHEIPWKILHLSSLPQDRSLCHILPVLLSLQQFPVGGDLNVQSQLHVHQLLVLADLQGHVLLGSLEGCLQVSDAELGVLHRNLTTLLGLCDLGFQTVSLRAEKKRRRKPVWGEVQKCSLSGLVESQKGRAEIVIKSNKWWRNGRKNLIQSNVFNYTKLQSVNLTCALTMSISDCSLFIKRVISAISALDDFRSSPYLPADCCISAYCYRQGQGQVDTSKCSMIIQVCFNCLASNQVLI